MESNQNKEEQKRKYEKDSSLPQKKMIYKKEKTNMNRHMKGKNLQSKNRAVKC